MRSPLRYQTITEPIIVDAFYLADRQDEHIVDDLIAAGTGIFPCNWGTIATSHEERGVFVDGQLWFFSSSAHPFRDPHKPDGTRWIRGRRLLKSPERWALRGSPLLTDDEIQVEISRANSLLGRRYDFIGVILDFLRPGILFNQRKKIYCSKACHFMHTGNYKRISPRRRSRYIKRHGYTPLSVKAVLAMETAG